MIGRWKYDEIWKTWDRTEEWILTQYVWKRFFLANDKWEHDEKTVELAVNPDGFSRNMKRGNKGSCAFLQTILGCWSFFSLRHENKLGKLWAFTQPNKWGLHAQKAAGTETMNSWRSRGTMDHDKFASPLLIDYWRFHIIWSSHKPQSNYNPALVGW